MMLPTFDVLNRQVSVCNDYCVCFPVNHAIKDSTNIVDEHTRRWPKIRGFRIEQTSIEPLTMSSGLLYALRVEYTINHE